MKMDMEMDYQTAKFLLLPVLKMFPDFGRQFKFENVAEQALSKLSVEHHHCDTFFDCRIINNIAASLTGLVAKVTLSVIVQKLN